MRKILESCPTCGGPLVITTVRCERCATEVRSEYAPCPFCRLNSEQLSFVLLFLQNRGNLSEMEKALGVSYPTIRGKLDEILRVVTPAPPSPAPSASAAAPVAGPAGGPPPAPRPAAGDRRAVLDAIARGKLSAADGLAALRSLASRPADAAPSASGEAPPTGASAAEHPAETTDETAGETTGEKEDRP